MSALLTATASELSSEKDLVCQAPSCWDDAAPIEMDSDDVNDPPILCDIHRKAYLGVHLMARQRVREFYRCCCWTDYRLRKIESIKDDLNILFSISERFNSCCSARAAAVFSGRLRQLASTPAKTDMAESSIKYPRLEHLEQWQPQNRSTLKTRYRTVSNCWWNTGTMQIRYCSLVDGNSSRFSHVFNKIEYAVPTVPLFHQRFSLMQSCGFVVEQFSHRHCSTCSNISGVIV